MRTAETGTNSDVFNISGDGSTSFVVAQDFRLRVLVHEARNETRRSHPLTIYVAVRNDGVLRIRMEWVGEILRVRLEAEQLTAPFRPCTTFRTGVSVDV